MILSSLGRQDVAWWDMRKDTPAQGYGIYKTTDTGESTAYTGNTTLMWFEVGGMGRDGERSEKRS